MTNQNGMNMNDDPWARADNAKPREFEYYGQVKADVWFGFFPGNKQKPIPWDATQHPADKKATIIEVQIIPIPEQNITFQVNGNYTDFSADWTRITLPSIKALGLDGLRSLNNRYVKVIQVDGKTAKKDESGNKTDEFYKTLKFVELFADEASCRAAYSGPQSEEPEPTASAIDEGRKTALAFAAVVVENAARGQTDPDVIRDTLILQLAGMPQISNYFTADSPEIQEMVQKALKK